MRLLYQNKNNSRKSSATDSFKPILIIEDDEVDFMIVKRVLKSLEVQNELLHKTNSAKKYWYI